MSGPPQIFDRSLYAQRRLRAAGTDLLLQDVAAHLGERIAILHPTAGLALDLSSRQESFAVLRASVPRWVRTGFFPGAADLVTEEEWLPFAPGTFDVIVSILSLHAVNDLPGALVQIRHALKPGGLFVAALFGGSTLRELREAFAAGESEVCGGSSPRVAPFADVRDLGALLQRAGFANPVADLERSVVHYRDLTQLVSDLRALGETNALVQRSRKFLRRKALMATVSHYTRSHKTADGRMPATFDIIYLTGRSPVTRALASSSPSR